MGLQVFVKHASVRKVSTVFIFFNICLVMNVLQKFTVLLFFSTNKRCDELCVIYFSPELHYSLLFNIFCLFSGILLSYLMNFTVIILSYWKYYYPPSSVTF